MKDLTTVNQLATYSGESAGEMTKTINDLTSASFPQKDAENYIQTLMQLGVPNDLLEKNAQALNEIQIGTGASCSNLPFSLRVILKS